MSRNRSARSVWKVSWKNGTLTTIAITLILSTRVVENLWIPNFRSIWSIPCSLSCSTPVPGPAAKPTCSTRGPTSRTTFRAFALMAPTFNSPSATLPTTGFAPRPTLATTTSAPALSSWFSSSPTTIPTVTARRQPPRTPSRISPQSPSTTSCWTRRWTNARSARTSSRRTRRWSRCRAGTLTTLTAWFLGSGCITRALCVGMNCPPMTPNMRIGHGPVAMVVVVVVGRGLMWAIVAVAVAREGEIIELFTGLLEYFCGLLLMEVTRCRTMPKGDGKVGIEICVSSSCFIIVVCLFYFDLKHVGFDCN